MSGLEQLARDLAHAAGQGGAVAGSAAVHAGMQHAEIGMRAPGVGVAATGSGLSARLGITQKRGVYQESAPATAVGVDVAAIADGMAEVAAAVGAKEIS